MECYKISELCIRSSRPLFALLDTSCGQQATKSPFALTRQSAKRRHTGRSFSTTILHRRDQPAQSKSTPPETRTANEEIARLLDDSFSARGPRSQTPQRRPSLSEPRQKPSTPSSTPSKAPNDRMGSSLQDLLGSLQPARTTSASSTSSRDSILSYLDPMKTTRVPPLRLGPAPFRLRPSLGRTIKVDPARGKDVAGAFRGIEGHCARNSIRADFQRQRFHERPGLKRKRLKSERYRKNFKVGFQAMISRVRQMRKMGW